ncbi:MAG: thymidine phosphorylase [Gemmatimonadota bacterium]
MLPSELIERKRDGHELTREELGFLLSGFQAGDVADYQISAFLMAVYFRGLSAAELSALTGAMIDSGRRLDFSGGETPAVDKHSTGGVGDKVSLVLAPLLAEFGLRVPMMSGRGLGHTGGTLDKLDAIPGFRTQIDLTEFEAILAEVGCAMIGQTPDVAPLDGRLYALRDVTATVQSIPLIASSIISKKVAEGTEALVLDVKYGSGAFMPDYEDALELAQILVTLAAAEGLKASALLTAMEQPLGVTVGNALEVRESIDTLRGGGPADLREVTLALCAEAAVLSGLADESTARARLEEILDSGAALERFAKLIERQGGDPGVVEDADRLPSAPVREPWLASHGGFVGAIDARQVGLAAIELGAGRARIEDVVDPAVGFEIECAIGDSVETGQRLATIHAASESAAEAAADRLRRAIALVPDPPPEAPPLVRCRIEPGG